MTLKNKEISLYIQNLQGISNKVSGKLAYCVAKNLRKLIDEIVEYETIKNNLINKYGTPDESGVCSIQINSKEYSDFLNEIEQYANIEQEVNIIKVEPEDIYSSTLTATEILSIDFMINDEITE